MSTIQPIHLPTTDSSTTSTNSPPLSRATLSTKRVWKCHEEECEGKANFSTYKSLKHHIHHNHPRKIYKCHHCPLKFTYQRDYLSHVKMVKERLTCKVCGGIAKDMFQLHKHFETSHNSLYLRCLMCKRNFVSNLTFNTHHHLYHTNKPHTPPCKRVKIVCGDVEISQVIVSKNKSIVRSDETQLESDNEKSLFESISVPKDDESFEMLSSQIADKLFS